MSASQARINRKKFRVCPMCVCVCVGGGSASTGVNCSAISISVLNTKSCTMGHAASPAHCHVK